MNLLGVVHQLYGTDNHELHYSYINVNHIAYMTKFHVGDIKTLIVLVNGTSFYCTQDTTELQRDLATATKSNEPHPFLV